MKLPKIPIANVDTKILLSGYEAIGHYHDIKYFVSFYRNSETGGEFWLDSCSRPVMLTHLSLMPEFVEVKQTDWEHNVTFPHLEKESKGN